MPIAQGQRQPVMQVAADRFKITILLVTREHLTSELGEVQHASRMVTMHTV
jgi:hypothetical protein